MPGKHAPGSSKSFLISLGTAIGGALVALGVVVGIAVVALNAGREPDTGGPAIQSPAFTTSPTSSPEPSPSVVESPTSSPSPDALLPAETTVRVLNGTDRAGLAAQTAERIQAAGYPEPAIGNAARTTQSTVYYRADAREEAELFQQTFSEFTEIAPAPSSFATDVMLTVVIGEDFPQESPAPSPS